eukprot:CAMPEP_0180005292 /NCGR_PEP_ID=MMETSP0984-20121128/12611_1 /TAXON_ID=483367 /ORGANISM="non described non described, Strain CCMP 2436" /LENGTH=31 /DNA_ID= /DNA_START= /DNA_END= /DNA_ORIENTATION=
MTLDERHPLPLRRVQGGVILKRLLPLPLRRV